VQARWTKEIAIDPSPTANANPFDIAGTRVTDCEHAGQTGFEEMRSPGERPMRLGQFIPLPLHISNFGFRPDHFNDDVHAGQHP
jgi:hypothetical protein